MGSHHTIETATYNTRMDFTNLMQDEALVLDNDGDGKGDGGKHPSHPPPRPKLPARKMLQDPLVADQKSSSDIHDDAGMESHVLDPRQASIRKTLDDLAIANDEYSSTTLLGVLRLWGERSIFTGKRCGKECGGTTLPQSQWAVNRAYLTAQREAKKQAKLAKKQQKEMNTQNNLTTNTVGVSVSYNSYAVTDSPLAREALLPPSDTIDADTDDAKQEIDDGETENCESPLAAC